MALLDDYHSALDAFMASPSETGKAAVLCARAKLPDASSGEGGSATLVNLSTLETTLSAMVGAVSRTDPRRLIRTGLSHGC